MARNSNGTLVGSPVSSSVQETLPSIRMTFQDADPHGKTVYVEFECHKVAEHHLLVALAQILSEMGPEMQREVIETLKATGRVLDQPKKLSVN